MPDEVKEAIRERTDLVALVGETVDLKRSGTRFKGLCPFHAEKTPSFMVDPARGSFHCFGCGEHGDAITFVRETRGVAFMEALRFLGGRVGVEIPEIEVSDEEEAAARERREHKEWLRKANELAAAFFERELEEPGGAAARAYLEQRGIGDAIRKGFGLGYAPASWDALVEHLVGNGVATRYVVETGLAKRREGGEGHYAFFRNRLACPVRDAYGRVVAFSARALTKDEEAHGKYRNSPESAIFQKRRLLFGLEQARPSIRSSGRAVLVEGNFDALSMHKAGFTETVASLGTALTSEQVGLLHRQTESVVLLYDGDRAGRQSALKAVPLFVDEGLMARVAVLPDGCDPDDLVRTGGAEAMTEVLEASLPAVEFAIREILPARDAAPEDKERAVAAAGRLVSRLRGGLARAEYRRLTADLLGVPEQDLTRYFRGAPPPAAPAVTVSGQGRRKPGYRSAELLRLVVLHPELADRVREADVVGLVRDEALRTALQVLLDLHAAGEPPGETSLLDALEEPVRTRLADVLAGGLARDEELSPGQLLEGVLVELGRRRTRRQDALVEQVRQAAGDEDAERSRLLSLQGRLEEKRRLGSVDGAGSTDPAEPEN